MEGLYSAKSSIRPHLRRQNVADQGPMEAADSAVPIYASKETVFSNTTRIETAERQQAGSRMNAGYSHANSSRKATPNSSLSLLS